MGEGAALVETLGKTDEEGVEYPVFTDNGSGRLVETVIGPLELGELLNAGGPELARLGESRAGH